MLVIDAIDTKRATDTEACAVAPVNLSEPPDGFDPARDGAALWLAMRMRYRTSSRAVN